MKRICSNCGKEFEAKGHRQTCSTVCRYNRQNEAVKQMKSKSGEIYLRWHNHMLLGIARKSKARSEVGRRITSKKKGVI